MPLACEEGPHAHTARAATAIRYRMTVFIVAQALSAVARMVVVAQQIAAEIAAEITPHCMDVIGFVLRIVVFDQETGRLHAVVMRLAAGDTSRPRKLQLVA